MAASYNDPITYNSIYWRYDGLAFDQTPNDIAILEAASGLASALDDTGSVGSSLEEVGAIANSLDKAR